MPSQLELVNKDCHIAALTDSKAVLEMEIQVEKGIGYVPRELTIKEKQEIGAIALDAIFTPVKRVAVRVENMRVGKKTDFDKLFLEVETDGTISPEDAFSQASEILLKHFDLFFTAFVAVKAKEKKEKKEPSSVKALKEKAGKSQKKAKKDEKKKKRKKT